MQSRSKRQVGCACAHTPAVDPPVGARHAVPSIPDDRANARLPVQCFCVVISTFGSPPLSGDPTEQGGRGICFCLSPPVLRPSSRQRRFSADEGPAFLLLCSCLPPPFAQQDPLALVQLGTHFGGIDQFAALGCCVTLVDFCLNFIAIRRKPRLLFVKHA
jgi:hypothetical protein